MKYRMEYTIQLTILAIYSLSLFILFSEEIT